MKDNNVFTLKQIEGIKNSQNQQTKEIAAAMIKLADELVSGKRDWFGELRGGLSIMEPIGFAYYFTGDLKYFNFAKQTMDETCLVEDWFPHNAHGGNFKGRSDLISVRRARYIAYGYTFFYDLFTDEEKAYYVEQNLKKGIRPVFEDWVLHDTRIHALDTMGHNFWTYLIANGGLAALIMSDAVSECFELAQLAAKSLKAWFEYEGNAINCKPQNIDNGGYWEGADYFSGAIQDYAVFAHHYKNKFGKKPFDDKKVLESCADYIVNFIYPTSCGDFKPDFGDSSNKKVVAGIAPLIEYGIVKPEYIWFLKRGFVINPYTVSQVLIWDEISNKAATAPESLSYYCGNIGWAEFRDSFEENKTMLAIKCGDTFNHTHADAGSFILYRNGKAEISEGGEPLNYGQAAYQKYYVQSIAHNVVLFEGKGQDYRDNYKDHVHNKGRMPYYKDEKGFRYLLADASGPMGRYFRKHHRHFLWIDKCILIYDDIECYENGTCNYLIHEEFEGTCFRMLTPCDFTLQDGYREKSGEPNCKYKSYNLETDSDGHAKFVSLLSLDENTEPVYEKLDTYIKVSYGETKFYINLLSDGKIMHNNCIIEAGSYVTDAVILVDNKDKQGIVNGSILRKGDNTLFGSWHREFGYV